MISSMASHSAGMFASVMEIQKGLRPLQVPARAPWVPEAAPHWRQSRVLGHSYACGHQGQHVD